MVAAAPMYRMAAVARLWLLGQLCLGHHDREFVCRWFPERVLPPPPSRHSLAFGRTEPAVWINF